MRKYPQKNMPKVNVYEFLLKLPCCKCGGKTKRLEVLQNGFRVPVCGGCDIVTKFPASAKLEKLARDLDLMAGNVYDCTAVIAKLRREIFQ